MVCSGTFKLCLFLSCLSPHSPQLTLDCQTDKFSAFWVPKLTDALGVEGPPCLPAPSPCSELPGLEAASFGRFPHCLQLCFCALEQCATASLCQGLFIDVSPYFVSPCLFIPSSSCYPHCLHPWERFRQNRILPLLLSSLFRSSPSS